MSASKSGQALLLRRNGQGQWRSPEVQRYGNEEMLKRLLRESPELLSTYVEGSAFVEELSVPLIGAVDLAGVDPNGGVTLVECKLERNPEIRRKVVGQIFAYAAGLWQVSYDDFDRAFSARANQRPLADCVRAALPVHRREEWNEEEFRVNVADSLKQGRFTLVIAVDEITEELRRVVPFINSHTSSDVSFYALEVGYVQDGDVELVMPSTYGTESVEVKSASRARWTESAYFEKLQEYGDDVAAVILRLFEFSKARGAQFTFGTGAMPSLNARFVIGAHTSTVWSSYLQNNGPTVDFNFEYFRDTCPPERVAAMANELRRIPGAANIFSDKTLAEHPRPSLRVKPLLMQTSTVDTILTAFGHVVD